ncbi:MAG: Bax inhibitor-1 family protein [Planctomycetes bacterium]|nr:Bax inhibitor-1 family protein [Planctomycetota bacterium]
MNNNKYNNKGYQNYGPVNQGQAPAQPAQDQWGGAPQADHTNQPHGILQNQYGDPAAAHDLSNPAVIAFTKKVYAYFASALATATAASLGGVMITNNFIAQADPLTGALPSGFGAMRIGSMVAFFVSFLAVIFMRNTKSPLRTGLLYVFSGACGFMIAPMLTFLIAGGMGMSIVFAFGITTVVFGGLTVYVLSTGKDFRSLGGILFVGLIVAFGLILMNVFIDFPSGMSRLIMAGILLLFVGYTLYDTSKVTRDYFVRDDAIGAAMMLFYDFFILFKYILYFMGSSRS